MDVVYINKKLYMMIAQYWFKVPGTDSSGI